jgi:hypothetical protein
MDELFRFLLLRPATVVAPDDVNQLAPSFVPAGTPLPQAQRQARAFTRKSAFVNQRTALQYSGVALQVVNLLQAGKQPAANVVSVVQSAIGRTPAQLVTDATFTAEQSRVNDSLAAMKLLSDSSGGDAAGLTKVAQGYDAISLVARGRDPVGLRVLALDGFAVESGTPAPSLPPGSPPPPANDGSKTLAAVERAIAALRAGPASGFAPPTAAAPPAAPQRRSQRTAGPAAPAGTQAGGQSAGPWLLSADTIKRFPSDVLQTLSSQSIDLKTQSLPVVLAALYSIRAALQASVAAAAIPTATLIGKVGVAFGPTAANNYVGPPSGTFPTGSGNIRPVGVGDLLMVKEHILRYEGGELAHVENVLKSERMDRNTRRLERTETTITQETETTKEEESDTQSTDRFNLKRETSDTIKNDSAFKAGLSVDASYGPFVEVKANAEYSTATSTESSVKQSAEFSKEVVSRSVSKLTERVLERRTVTTLTEFEEKYDHSFDNTSGTGHITGFYQWIDKVSQAQVYNYGKRLLFDVVVPEPGTNYIVLQTSAQKAQAPLEEPPEFTDTAFELDEGKAVVWAKMYGATGLEPPLPPVRTFVQNFDKELNGDPWDAGGSNTFALDDGYRAKYVYFATDYWAHDTSQAWWSLLVGGNRMQVISAFVPYMDMAGEEHAVAFSYDAHQLETMSANIQIFCERTEKAFEAWQLKTHDAITQAYQAKLQVYQEALAQAQAAATAQIAGQNPDFNQRIIAGELRRQCLTLVTAQQFDAFGALDLSAEGYAQPNLDRTAQQMPYVRFFEQAFEWEHIVYFFYPYFWGWKPGWRNRIMLDDTDPAFGDFLRAGAARVVFPVRPGFEAAIVHYLETGELWNGGPPPDITSSLYVPIVQEIEQATGAPGNETPVGDPWEVRVPTTLVRLRPNNDLPTWQKVGEVWQESN